MNIENVLMVRHFLSGGKGHWRPHIEEQFSLPYIRHLRKFLRLEREASACNRNCSIYPEPEQVFQALESTPPNSVKVVILGQDPYPNRKADGLAFSMGNLSSGGISHRSSLGKIFGEVNSDLNGNIPFDGSVCSLQSWADRGVLLLNSILSVRKGRPKSHSCHGWERFTDEIIRTVNVGQNSKVFLLWGKEAQRKRTIIDEGRHCVLCADHPAWQNENNNFVRCEHFSQANEYLSRHGRGEIDWLSVCNQG